MSPLECISFSVSRDPARGVHVVLSSARRKALAALRLYSGFNAAKSYPRNPKRLHFDANAGTMIDYRSCVREPLREIRGT